MRERSRTTLFLADQVAVRLDRRFVELDQKALATIAKDREGYVRALTAVHQHLSTIDGAGWEAENLEGTLRNVAQEMGVGAGKVFQPVRIALTGTTVSEPVNVLLSLVGRDESLGRLQRAIEGVRVN